MPWKTGTRKQEHPDQRGNREAQDDERVDHRALHAATDLHLLLDLQGDPVQDRVENARSLAGLDHRDVEPIECVRMARHRLREQHPALDVGAHFANDEGKVLVVGLLLEDHERLDHTEPGVDHRRELSREDLQKTLLDLLLLLRPDRVRSADLGQRNRPQPLLPQELPGRAHVGRGDLSSGLGPERVDRTVGEGRH